MRILLFMVVLILSLLMTQRATAQPEKTGVGIITCQDGYFACCTNTENNGWGPAVCYPESDTEYHACQAGGPGSSSCGYFREFNDKDNPPYWELYIQLDCDDGYWACCNCGTAWCSAVCYLNQGFSLLCDDGGLGHSGCHIYRTNFP